MADETCEVATDDLRAVTGLLNVLARTFGSNLQMMPGFGAALEAMGRLELAAEHAGLPDDPVVGLLEIAVRQHAIMEAYMTAGFDRSEAFSLTHAHVAGAAMRQGHGG